jgi:hypothetical protein
LLDVLSDIRLSECAARAVDVRAYRLYVLRQLMLCHEYQGKLDGGFSSQRDMLREAQTWLERAVFAE